jgi:hypothetical protein
MAMSYSALSALVTVTASVAASGGRLIDSVIVFDLNITKLAVKMDVYLI